MKKRTTISMIICLFLFPVMGQELDWSEEIKPVKKFAQISLVGEIDETIVIREDVGAQITNGILIGERQSFLISYDQSFAPMNEKKISMEFEGKKLLFIDCHIIQEKLFALCSYDDAKSGKTTFHMLELEPETFDLVGEGVTIGEVETGRLDLNLENLRRNVRPFKGQMSSISPNKRYFAFLMMGPIKEEEAVDYTVKVFDQDMNPFWEKEVGQDVEDYAHIITNMRVDDNGNVYLVGGASLWELEEESLSSIWAYRNRGSNFQNYPLDVGPLDLIEGQLTFGKDDEVIYASVATKRTKVQDITMQIPKPVGMYYMLIDGGTSKVKEENLHMFDKAVDSNLWAVESEMFETSFAMLRHIFLCEDGDILLVVEKLVNNVVSEAGVKEMIRLDHLGDLFIWKINPAKGIVWSTQIEKYLREAYGRFTFRFPSRMITYFQDDAIQLLYTANELTKKASNPKAAKPKDLWTYTILDVKSGQIKTRILSGEFPDKGWLRSSRFQEPESREFLFLYDKARTYQLGTVKFE